jgi:hypothetical protein
MDSMQDAYVMTKKKLDQLGYNHPLHIDSTLLVKTMLKDMGDLTRAFQNLNRQVKY